MNIETYREIFHCVSFPVFALSKDCKLVYKNLACAKYFPQIYNSRSVKNKIYPSDLKESQCVRVFGGSSYSIALALKDDNRMVFIGLSRFQQADGFKVVNEFLKTFGTDLLEFLSGFRKQACSEEHLSFATQFPDENFPDINCNGRSFWNCQSISLVDALDTIFKKLNEFFEPLDYNLIARIEKTSPSYLLVRISPNDLLFLIGKLLYLIMKYSETRQVEMVLFPEFAYSHLVLCLMTKTKLRELPQTQGNNILLLEKLMPECAAEIELLDRVGLMKNTDFSVYIDSFGMMSITYKFPYSEPGFAVVQSGDDVGFLYADHIDIMANGIWARLKDKDASC